MKPGIDKECLQETSHWGKAEFLDADDHSVDADLEVKDNTSVASKSPVAKKWAMSFGRGGGMDKGGSKKTIGALGTSFPGWTQEEMENSADGSIEHNSKTISKRSGPKPKVNFNTTLQSTAPSTATPTPMTQASVLPSKPQVLLESPPQKDSQEI